MKAVLVTGLVLALVWTGTYSVFHWVDITIHAVLP